MKLASLSAFLFKYPPFRAKISYAICRHFAVMLELKNLIKRYQLGDEIWELGEINLYIASGEFVSISGTSGSGKSTLLYLMGALDHPTSGEVIFQNQKFARMNDTEISRFRNQEIGFVFQEFYLYPDIDLVENVALPLTIAKVSKKLRLSKAHEVIEEVGLKGLERHSMNEMSGGQRQRAAIARAIIHRPRLLLADEPTGNLDSKTGAEILALLSQLHNKHGMTLVVVSHDSAITKHAKRHIVLEDGRIVKDDFSKQ